MKAHRTVSQRKPKRCPQHNKKVKIPLGFGWRRCPGAKITFEDEDGKKRTHHQRCAYTRRR